MLFNKSNFEHVDSFVNIVTLSAPEFIYTLFDGKTDKLLRYLYEKPNTVFSSDFYYILTDDSNEVTGGVLAYDFEEYRKSMFKTALLVLYKMNFAIMGNLHSLIKAQSMIGNFKKGEMYISNIAVLPAFRDKGFGSELLDNIEKVALEKGCNNIVLDVDVDNKKAISLYRRLGFQQEVEVTQYRLKGTIYKFTKMVKKL